MSFGTGFPWRFPSVCMMSVCLFFSIIPSKALHAGSLTCPEVNGRATQGSGMLPEENNGQIPSTKKSQHPPFATDRLIVKLKDAVTESADILFDSGVLVDQGTVSNGGELGKLNEKFQVKSIKPLFQAFANGEKEKTRMGTRSKRKEQLAELFERSRSKHSKRAARAPEGSAIPELSSIYILSVPEGTDILAACKSYSANPNVEYAIPSYTMEPQSVANDPYFSSRGSWGNSYDDMWALKRIKADLAWDTAQGEGVVVAVIDTGLDYNHVDIAGNVWTNTLEASGVPGVDDDNNGYVDDIRGWHFDYAEGYQGGQVSESEIMDTDGHGTFVAGIIGAVGNNGTGIIGVAPMAKIMPVKIMRNNGFSLSEAYANGILYAAHNGADVINLSWGCSDCTNSAGNPLVADAVKVANGLGAIVVTSADNWRTDVRDAFPANIQEAITVASTDQNDDHSSFSNRGFFVDVAAPGGGGWYTGITSNYSILSLLSSTPSSTAGQPVGAGYLRGSGTSASAAFVSGVAALVLSANPELSREQVISIIRHSADDQVGNLSLDTQGYDPYFGWGRVNAARAVSMALAPPTDPPILKVPSDGYAFDIPQMLCSQERVFSFDIYNIGGGTLDWSLGAPSWITPLTASGSDFSSPVMKINTDQSVSGAITVSSNGDGVSTADVPVSVAVLPDIKLSNCSMALATAPGNQQWDQARNGNPPAIPDGLGGAYYVWYGYVPGQSLYKVVIQRVDSNGMPLWGTDGLIVSSSDRFQYSPTVISDGAGGAIILWIDGLNTGDYGDKNLAAQRVSSSGELLWGSAGIAVTQTGSVVDPVIIPDGSGGAIVGWTKLKSTDDDVYAQRISASGALLWQKDGAPVSTAATYEFNIRIAGDGNGGAIFTWEDGRTPFHDVYAQHLDKDGVPLWQQYGILLSSQQAFGAGGANIVADGMGGAIIAWFDGRNHPSDGEAYYSTAFDIYAARVNGAGQQLWTTAGVPVVSGLRVPRMNKVDMVSDGQQGAVISWIDLRNSDVTIKAKNEMFAQRINGAGEAVWAADGVPVLSAQGWGIAPILIPDGDGGVIFTWQDGRFGNFDIYLQQLKADGSLRWGAKGVWVHSGSRDQVDPYLVPLGGNKLAITWNDWSNFFQSGIDFRGEVVQLCTDHDGDGSYAEGGVCGPVTGSDPVLAVLRKGTGQGSVQSLPSGINCGADCSRPFALGTVVTLKAVAAPNSFFSGWTGGECSGSGECTVTLGADTTVQASFTGSLPVKIAENGTSIYTSPQQAYNNAFSGNTIISKAQSFSENLNLNLPVSVNLIGGYDADFVSNPNYTEINGTVTVTQGSVTIDNIVIK